jgi:hypothetical protein
VRKLERWLVSGLALSAIAVLVSAPAFRPGISPLADALIFPLLFLALGLFLLPGLAASGFILERGALDARLGSFLCCLAGVASGLASLWLHLVSAHLGLAWSLATGIFSAMCLVHPELRRLVLSAWKNPDIKIPLTLTVLIGAVYTAIDYSIYFPWRALQLDEFGKHLTPHFGYFGHEDYRIQFLLGEHLRGGFPIWNMVMDKFHTTGADRPPLLAGISLLLGRLLPSDMQLHGFMAAGIAAQLTWVTASWGVLRALGLTARKSALAIVLLAQTSFVFWFSAFPLPKLLGGALTAGAFVLLVLLPRLENRLPSWSETLLGALAAAIGALSHPANAIILLPMGALLLGPKSNPGARKGAAMAFVFAAILIPWFAFQSANEPHTTGLLRYLLANPGDLKTFLDPNISTWQAMRMAYQSMTWPQIFVAKVKNVLELANFLSWYVQVDPIKLPDYPIGPWVEALARCRSALVLCLLGGLGPLALGLFPRRRFRQRGLLLAVSFPAILLTPLLSYDSYSASVPYLPLGAVLILSLLAVAEVSAWPRPHLKALALATSAFFVFFWVLAIPVHPFSINLVVSGVGLLAVCALATLLKDRSILFAIPSARQAPKDARRPRAHSRVIKRKARASRV